MPRFALSSIRDPEERTNAWIEVGIVLLLAVIPHYVTLFLLSTWQPLPPLQDSFQLLAYSVPVCAVVLYFMWRSEMAWPHFGLGKNFDSTGIGIYIAAVIAGLGIVSILTRAIHMTWPMSPEEIERTSRYFVSPKTTLDWFPFAIASAVAIAAEELAIRGFLTIRLYDLLGRKALSVVAPALLFGGYHYYLGLPNAVAMGVEGILFGWMQLSSRRLKALILAHLTINVVFASGWSLV